MIGLKKLNSAQRPDIAEVLQRSRTIQSIQVPIEKIVSYQNVMNAPVTYELGKLKPQAMNLQKLFVAIKNFHRDDSLKEESKRTLLNKANLMNTKDIVKLRLKLTKNKNREGHVEHLHSNEQHNQISHRDKP